MKDIESKPLTWGAALEVRSEILKTGGHKSHRKARLAALAKFGHLFPTLDVELSEEPTEAEKEADRAKPAQVLVLARAEWNAILHGFQVRLQGEETESAAVRIMRAAKLLRMRGECLKALPDGEPGTAKADDEPEAEPDAK